MDNQPKDRSLLSEINVTPLVDVMLVLLIIFMVTAPMMQQGIDVDLPNVVAKDVPVKEEKLVLTITKKREIFINEQPVEILRLREKLKKMYKNRAIKEIFLKADENVPYGFVVKMMAEIREAGIERLGMITVPPEEKR
ncbi:MAG: ExbD/TolR family protein [Thermodesulfobacteriota bacterium]|nr:ExbD/TolR family protein [Thermodesulfobacteriota bacterium]